MRITGIYLSQCILAIYIFSYYSIKKDFKLLFSNLILVAVLSSFILIGQTKLSINIWPIKLFQSIGLVSAGDRDYQNGFDAVFYSKGIGLSATVTDFASHLWILVFLARTKVVRLFSVIVFSINQSLSGVLGFIISIISKRTIFVIVCLIFLPFIFFRLNFIGLIQGDNSLLSRFIVWDKSVNLWIQNPILGVGLGSNIDLLRTVNGYFLDFPFADIRIAIHSVFFDLLSGTGFIGISLYFLFLFKTFRKAEGVLKLAFLYSIVFALLNNSHYMNYDLVTIGALICAGNE